MPQLSKDRAVSLAASSTATVPYSTLAAQHDTGRERRTLQAAGRGE
ncbi:hypothetical protein [Streptomyces sp. 7N604]